MSHKTWNCLGGPLQVAAAAALQVVLQVSQVLVTPAAPLTQVVLALPQVLTQVVQAVKMKVPRRSARDRDLHSILLYIFNLHGHSLSLIYCLLQFHLNAHNLRCSISWDLKTFCINYLFYYFIGKNWFLSI